MINAHVEPEERKELKRGFAKGIIDPVVDVFIENDRITIEFASGFKKWLPLEKSTCKCKDGCE